VSFDKNATDRRLGTSRLTIIPTHYEVSQYVTHSTLVRQAPTFWNTLLPPSTG